MLGLEFQKTGYPVEDCPRYSLRKVAMLDKDKFTYVGVGSGELGFAYAMKEKDDGTYCWYGPQKTIRPNIGKRLLVWGGHFSDWIATSAVQAYCVINDPEGADKLVIGKEVLDAMKNAGPDLMDHMQTLKDGDAIFVTRNSIYTAKKQETVNEYKARKAKEAEENSES